MDGRISSDRRKNAQRNKRWSEAEKEAPIIKKAAYKLIRGPDGAGNVGVEFHIRRLDR
jgi:hypothetical protein